VPAARATPSRIETARTAGRGTVRHRRTGRSRAVPFAFKLTHYQLVAIQPQLRLSPTVTISTGWHPYALPADSAREDCRVGVSHRALISATTVRRPSFNSGCDGPGRSSVAGEVRADGFTGSPLPPLPMVTDLRILHSNGREIGPLSVSHPRRASCPGQSHAPLPIRSHGVQVSPTTSNPHAATLPAHGFDARQPHRLAG